MRIIIQASSVRLPAAWASALINGDWSGLDEAETRKANFAINQLAADGWYIAGAGEGNPFGEIDYITHRRILRTEEE